ncbi:Urea transporter [Pandoraea morbifera]|uniref:Urea transporter n=2 Tax=Pandoraea morbifera TaxID=2508300 RepID=A0A5E4V849_9BURK|nr:urea transporter [Pandoraea morbifera]VVE08336.1 Urea transporter [Pandoraea morbifera]
MHPATSTSPGAAPSPTSPTSPTLLSGGGILQRLADALHGLAANFAQIYFIPSAGAGVLLLAVLALADRPAALTGLAASAIASAIAIALRLPAEQRRKGLTGYNAALTGVAFGALWQPGVAGFVWLAACVALTVVASAELARRRFPALTGPFIGVMALSWAAQSRVGLVPRASALACDAATPGFVFCSVGQVVFIAPLVFGLLTWYVLALWNVRATLWALAAAVAVWAGLVSATSLVSRTLPTWLASLNSLSSLGQSWPSVAAQAGGMGVNAFLAALGLGALGRPTAQRFAGAWLASILCVVLGHVLAPTGWPYFTLPFNLAVWAVLAVTRPRPSSAIA